MNSLMKAELLRLVSRRLLIVLLVAMAALAALGAAVSADDVRPLGAQDYKNAQHGVDSDTQYFDEECSDGSASKEFCDGWEKSSFEDYLREPVSFGEYSDWAVTLGLFIMLLAAAVLASALVGGEFSSGNIGTQLLFTPRRIPLFTAKVVASTLGGVLVALAHLGITMAISAIMFLSLRGATDMTAGIDLPLMLGRSMVLALLISIMAAALTMATGSTLITAGVFTVVLLGSTMLRDAVSAYSLLQLFLPSNIFLAMVDGINEIYDYKAMNYEGPPAVATVINYDWALAYSVVGTALIVAVSAWWFHRRDILR